jgi:hypothetical protein
MVQKTHKLGIGDPSMNVNFNEVLLILPASTQYNDIDIFAHKVR